GGVQVVCEYGVGAVGGAKNFEFQISNEEFRNSRSRAFFIRNSKFEIRTSLDPPLRHRHRRARPHHRHLLRLHQTLRMRPIDWLVLAATLLTIVAYGVWKGRKQRELAQYLLADRGLKWPTIALSIMATQASAITFLSTPGQAYADGMRFVQFYLG